MHYVSSPKWKKEREAFLFSDLVLRTIAEATEGSGQKRECEPGFPSWAGGSARLSCPAHDAWCPCTTTRMLVALQHSHAETLCGGGWVRRAEPSPVGLAPLQQGPRGAPGPFCQVRTQWEDGHL